MPFKLIAMGYRRSTEKYPSRPVHPNSYEYNETLRAVAHANVAHVCSSLRVHDAMIRPINCVLAHNSAMRFGLCQFSDCYPNEAGASCVFPFK